MNEKEFFKAAAEGNTAYLKHIYQESGKALNPNQTFGDYQEFPLFTAAKNGHADTVKFLLECKDNPINPQQLAKGGWSPLCIAALNGHLEVVKTLIEFFEDQPLDVNHATNEGMTPLFLATQEGHIEIVNYLLEKRCNVNLKTIYNTTALHIATLHGHDTIVRCLLEAAAHTDILDKSGNTPLDLAIITKKQNISKMLDGCAQNFHTALIQRMKILNFKSSRKGICFGFIQNTKNLLLTNNEGTITDYYQMLAWLKGIKAQDLREIQHMHNRLIYEVEKEVLQYFNVSSESELTQVEHLQFQNMVKDALVLRRNRLTHEEQENEYRYRYICSLFNPIALAHEPKRYLHLLSKYILQYLSNYERYLKSRPLNGQILLTLGENHILKYKAISDKELYLEHQITLDELKKELGDKYAFFEHTLETNNAVKLNFFLENILHIISLHKVRILQRENFLTQRTGSFWVNSIVQPQALEQKGGEAQLTEFTGVYQLNDLITYLTKFRENINKDLTIISPIALDLSSIDHEILIAYYPDKFLWEFVDINQISSKSNEIKRILLADEKEVAEKIQIAYSSKEYTCFYTLVSCSDESYNQLQPLITQWENDLQTLHTPTQEKIAFIDCFKGTWLLVAVKNGDYKTLQRLLAYKDHSLDPNQTEEGGATALFLAAELNNVNIVNLLLECNGIDPNKASEYNVTPLFIAAQSGHLETVKALLAHPLIDPNKALFKDDATPLFVAAQHGYVDIVKALLEHSLTDCNKALKMNATPLFVAAQNGHFEVVKTLLMHSSIDIDVTTKDGLTALDIAIINKHPDIAQFLQAYKVKLAAIEPTEKSPKKLKRQ